MNEHSYNLTVQRMGEAARVGQDVSGLMSIMKLVHTEQERDKFEVLLDVMGKDGANGRYLSLREIRVLFEERRLPTRMGKRLRRRD